MYSTADFKNGLKIELKGEPYTIVDFQHVKPGKGGAFVRTKLKNLLTGAVIDKTFRSGEKVPEGNVFEKEMEYLYREGNNYYFMDINTYEQISIPYQQIESQIAFLKENLSTKILFFNNNPISLELPQFVEIQVEKTEPGVKGNTATGATKPAKLETGAIIQVPLFISEGDTLKVDTRTGTYVERITK